MRRRRRRRLWTSLYLRLLGGSDPDEEDTSDTSDTSGTNNDESPPE